MFTHQVFVSSSVYSTFGIFSPLEKRQSFTHVYVSDCTILVCLRGQGEGMILLTMKGIYMWGEDVLEVRVRVCWEWG